MLNKDSIFLNKNLFLILLTLFSLSTVFSSENVIDITITEQIYQHVIYNPNDVGGGNFFDPGENQTTYILNGTIVVQNNHSQESIHDIAFNITSIGNISSLNYSSGNFGSVLLFNTTGDYAIIYIPDLGPGQSTTFTYTINDTNIRPPLNFTANYSDSRVLAGLTVGITDTVENVMDSNLYSDTCVYNITVTQNAQGANDPDGFLNFTFVNGSLTGSDATNATIIAPVNLTLNWNVSGLQCLYATNQTDISYTMQTPQMSLQTDYYIVNTTISYRLNTTISRIQLDPVRAVGDLEISFEKYLQDLINGSDGTWNITSQVTSLSNLTLNLTEVALWVSVRNATGTGFTNPSTRDNDTVSEEQLNTTYYPGSLINRTITPWNNSNSAWLFNYTPSPTPIVWMDVKNELFNDGVQITNRTVSYGNNEIYVKELYIATGYWLEITKNITRTAEGNYTILVEVRNRGTSPTPENEAVIVYNFIPIEFNLSSTFDFSSSTWYTTTETNTTLNDPIYNGTMYQFAIVANGNIYNSSLDRYGGTYHINNTWNVTFNVSGTGNFTFEDLFLTGVDPLNVKEFGATQALQTKGSYKIVSSKGEYLLAGVAGIVSILILLL